MIFRNGIHIHVESMGVDLSHISFFHVVVSCFWKVVLQKLSPSLYFGHGDHHGFLSIGYSMARLVLVEECFNALLWQEMKCPKANA